MIADQRSATSASPSSSVAPSSDLGSRRLDRPARLGQALAGQPDGVVDVASPVVRPVARLLGGLELGDDPGQPVGDGVVDLARHPRPLVEHARLSRLRDQLSLEPDVLVHGDLELGDGLPALLAQLGQPLAEDRPEPDHDGLDDDDRPVQEPQVGRRPREAGDERVDQDRGRGHADDRQRRSGRSTAAWKKPVIAKMKNIGLRVISSVAEREQADEVDDHPAAVLDARLGRPGEHHVHPDDGRRRRARA